MFNLNHFFENFVIKTKINNVFYTDDKFLISYNPLKQFAYFSIKYINREIKLHPIDSINDYSRLEDYTIKLIKLCVELKKYKKVLLDVNNKESIILANSIFLTNNHIPSNASIKWYYRQMFVDDILNIITYINITDCNHSMEIGRGVDSTNTNILLLINVVSNIISELSKYIFILSIQNKIDKLKMFIIKTINL